MPSPTANCASASRYSSGVCARRSLTVFSALHTWIYEHNDTKRILSYLARIALSPRTRLDNIWASSALISGGTTDIAIRLCSISDCELSCRVLVLGAGVFIDDRRCDLSIFVPIGQGIPFPIAQVPKDKIIGRRVPNVQLVVSQRSQRWEIRWWEQDGVQNPE